MNVRATLSHSTLGSVTVLPDGWRETKLRLERDEDFHSLIEYLNVEFIFFGNDGVNNGGVDFIRSALLIGFDELVTILYEVSFDDITWPLSFLGTLDLENSEEMADNKIKCPVLRDDAWSKFISRYETPVDVQTSSSLDNDPVNVFDQVNLTLISQKLQAISNHYSNETYSFSDFDHDNYIQVDFDTAVLDEIETKFNYPITWNTERPFEILATEYAGDYTFDIRMVWAAKANYGGVGVGFAGILDGSSVGTLPILDVYFQINDDAPIAFNYSDTDPGTTVGHVYSYNATHTINKGDFIRVYAVISRQNTPFGSYYIFGRNIPDSVNSGVNPLTHTLAEGIGDTHFYVTAATIFDDTNCESFLLHDVAGQILDRITGQNNIFYSEYLGSSQTVYRQYEEDGCSWTYALAKGLQIRQYSLLEKPFFMSFKQWWEGANPVLNLGLGYEEIDESTVFRVEQKEHFYADETPVVNFSFVRSIVKTYDQSRIFNKIEIGYKKWESEDISGIDDPQTKKVYATRFQRSGQTIRIHSEFIAASLAIETTRRKTREKSADYKFDNDVFIIAIAPTPVDISPETSPDVTDYEPELDENFDNVENLNNAETRYNLRLTPARNMLRWLKYLNGCLQSYLTSVYRFVSGEGNYDCITEMDVADCDENFGGDPLSEKQDLSPTTDFLHLPDLYEIEIDMSYEDYLLIRDNKKKPIGISQTDQDHTPFYIKDLEYAIFESKAIVTAWPKVAFSIVVPDVAISNDCELASTTGGIFDSTFDSTFE